MEALSDLELLASALEDAMEAHRAGLVVGWCPDAVALERTLRRARRQDAAPVLHTVVSAEVA